MKSKRLPYLQKLLNLGNSGGSSDQDDVVNVSLVHLGIAERLFDGLQSAAEEVGTQILETSASDRSVEVNAFKQRVDLDAAKREKVKKIKTV